MYRLTISNSITNRISFYLLIFYIKYIPCATTCNRALSATGEAESVTVSRIVTTLHTAQSRSSAIPFSATQTKQRIKSVKFGRRRRLAVSIENAETVLVCKQLLFGYMLRDICDVHVVRTLIYRRSNGDSACEVLKTD